MQTQIQQTGEEGYRDSAFLASPLLLLLLLLRVWTVLQAPGSNPCSPASHTQKPGAQPIRFKPREVLPSRAAVPSRHRPTAVSCSVIPWHVAPGAAVVTLQDDGFHF